MIKDPETRVINVCQTSHFDVELPGVKVFNVNEGDAPTGSFQDSSINTVILYSSSGMITICKRRAEDPQLRNFIDPRTWYPIAIETIYWDVTNCYKGIINSFHLDIPIYSLPEPVFDSDVESETAFDYVPGSNLTKYIDEISPIIGNIK